MHWGYVESKMDLEEYITHFWELSRKDAVYNLILYFQFPQRDYYTSINITRMRHLKFITISSSPSDNLLTREYRKAASTCVYLPCLLMLFPIAAYHEPLLFKLSHASISQISFQESMFKLLWLKWLKRKVILGKSNEIAPPNLSILLLFLKVLSFIKNGKLLPTSTPRRYKQLGWCLSCRELGRNKRKKKARHTKGGVFSTGGQETFFTFH